MNQRTLNHKKQLLQVDPSPWHPYIGGRWSGDKYVGTTCLRAAGSSPAPPAVWVFWHLAWRTESLDRGLILVCRFSFVSSRECIPVAAQTRSCLQGWMRVRNPLPLQNG
jgi:hypothetical protein